MKVQSKVFVHIYAGTRFTEESMLILAACDMSDMGYALIGETTIEIETDPLDVLQVQIKQLDNRIQEERTQSEVRVKRLEDTKNSLLSLENNKSGEM